MKDEGPFDHVLQFPDIPRPIVSQQLIHGPWPQRGDRGKVHLPGLDLQEVIGQRRDVLSMVAQRRDDNREDVKTVPQVFTEATITDHQFQIPVCGCDDPDVYRHRPAPAHPFDFHVLEHPQKPLWGQYGSGKGELSGPSGLAVDELGHIYVAEDGNHRIQKFDSNGNFIGMWGREGSGRGKFYFPEDVAVNAEPAGLSTPGAKTARRDISTNRAALRWTPTAL